MSVKNSKRQVKKIPKRTTLLQKLAYILRPFVLYMLVKTAAMLFLAIAIPALPITGIAAWVERNAHPLSAAVNGVASLAAVCFLLNDFLIEASTTGEVDIDKGIFGQMAGLPGWIYWESEQNRRQSALGCVSFLESRPPSR